MPRRLLLAYAGQHHNGHTLTDADLAQVAETGNQIGEAPMTIGHVSGTGHPRYGAFRNFSAGPATNPLTREATTGLFADGEPLPAVRDLINDGFYNQRSIGLSRDPQGRLYPHHVALLGATPPAVKGLEDLSFSAADLAFEATITETIDFYDGSRLTRLLANEIDRAAGAGSTRETVIQQMATEAEVEVVTVQHVLDGDIEQPRKEWLRAFARALGIAEQTLIDAADFWYADARAGRPAAPAPTPAPTPAPMPTRAPGSPDPAPTPFADDPEYQRMRAQVEAANGRHKAGQLAALREAMTGAAPPEVVDRLVAFADRLVPAGADPLNFADAGAAERTAEPIDELVAIVRAIPRPEHYGTPLDFGDPAPAEGDAERAQAASKF